MTYGLRVITKVTKDDDTTAPAVGDVMAPSRRWDDNEIAHPHCSSEDCVSGDCWCECDDCTVTTDYLRGTSAIFADPDDLSDAIRALRAYCPSATDPVVLLQSARYEVGEDADEVVLIDPVVLRVWTWSEIGGRR